MLCASERSLHFARFCHEISRVRSETPMQNAAMPYAGSHGNLPAQVTSFVGRGVELSEVRRLLGSTRLLTLTGIGGCGKTRLALESAACPQPFDGVWFVDLSGLVDAGLVLPAVAGVLRVREAPGLSLLEGLTAFLRPRQLLLVFDNCEHLIDACAALVETLLAAAPGLHILATSREALGIAGETTWSVPPLSLPFEGTSEDHSSSRSSVLSPGSSLESSSEAVQLFVERARGVQPAFELTTRNSAAVVQICRQLDGLPLALELAAARTNLLAVEQIAARLDESFGLLSHGGRRATTRHRSLSAALAWSYDLLTPPEQRLFCRLAAFTGGFSLEAAEAVGGESGDQTAAVLTLLGRLLEKSLVTMELRGGEARYRLLETLRQFGYKRLAAGGELERTEERCAEWFIAFTENANQQLHGTETGAALARIELERDNLSATMKWAFERGAIEQALRLGAALWYFLYLHGPASEGEARLWALLAHPSSAAYPVLRARVLIGAAYLARHAGRHAEAQALAEESGALARSAGDEHGVAFAAQTIGFDARVREDYDTARPLLEESLSVFRRLGDEFRVATSLHHLGLIAADGDGAYESARALQEESLAIYRRIGSQRQIALVLLALEDIARAERNLTGARALLNEALALLVALGDAWSTALALDHAALLVADEGAMSRGLLFAAAAAAICERSGSAAWPVVQRRRECLLAAARQTLGEDAFALTWAAGRRLSLAEAVAEALSSGARGQGTGDGEQGADPAPPPGQCRGREGQSERESAPAHSSVLSPQSSSESSAGLSRREREVLRLLAAGNSNQEIAAALVLSVYTVQNHLASIYAKVGARSRVDATAYALRHGLA
jgi:predicted ATPase/DNA-binding CsgD family transcriptional regulator